ncbi:hypothetical protein [Diaminobutyricibacter sp. McL0608]|uniref:hypothetical protein n=1 Tax=Leifsonia sp. McL0608 TaxID=3143537 RepID=UPI0031F2EF2C
MDVTSLDTVGLSISRRESRGHERGNALHSRAARGELVRLRRGVYADSGAWSEASPSGRYAALLLAAAETRSFTPVFSHVSAAFIWGLPIIGRWPPEAHLMSLGQRGLHSKNGVVWHHDKISADDVTEFRGLLVTTLERTLLDVAKTGPFVSAVTSIDFATKRTLALPDGTTAPGVAKGALLERLRRDGPRRGSAVARDAIEFSDARSGSPGESLSRVQIHLLGFPPPQLQTAVARPDGGTDYPDFEWDDVFGEFDGYAKYTRDEYTSGRDMAEIVWAEKLREDRLRSTGKRVCRWTWEVARSPSALEARLQAAGLSPIARR